MIKVLPQKIADQIAAGEVVERPVSVVKECVENSIDAEATQIEIHINNGGKTSITIIDNGKGMSAQDLQKSILRHATSKIHTIDDLFSIQSFGFRGEALAAISAVSDFELTSKKIEQDFGSKIEVKSNKKKFTENIPANNGTKIVINNLFNTTPARKQYLKTDGTEYREILKEIKAFALAHFDIRFTLFKDGKNVLDCPKTNQKQQRIQQLFSKKSDQLTPINLETPQLKISGFINRPEYCIANRNQQYFFVNSRKIVDYKLAYAVREAFNQSCGIEKHLHPFFVIFIEIDPILVDVNVHPRKLEVKFSEPREIFSAINHAVTRTLGIASSTPTNHFSTNRFTASPPHIPPKPSQRSISDGQTFNDFIAHKTSPPNIALSKSIASPQDQIWDVPVETNNFSEESILGELKLIGQITKKYILAESEAGVFFFDQHALHERQRFEYFWEKMKKQKHRTQKLLIKQDIQLPEEQISLLNENKSTLTQIGFSFNFLADDQITISAVPNFLEKEDLNKCLENIIEFLEHESIGEHHVDILLRKIIEYKACRGAVMFGDPLENREMQKILDDLKTTKFKWLCAHGRPNYWFIPFGELDQKFHR